VRPALAESLVAYGWRGSLALVVVVVLGVVVVVVVVVGKQDLGLHYFFMIKRETFSRTTRICCCLELNGRQCLTDCQRHGVARSSRLLIVCSAC